MDLRRGLGVRFRQATIIVSYQEWAKIQSGIFDLNVADIINRDLAHNPVAVNYDCEGQPDTTRGTLGFARDAYQKINAVLDESKAAVFMKMARGEGGLFQLVPKPGYEGRVTMTEINDGNGFLQAMRIDLKRGF